MSLIFAKGFGGEVALAELWRRCALAEAESRLNSLDGAKLVAAAQAKAVYEAAATQADAVLANEAEAGRALTHVLIAGVGSYEDVLIPEVTTSVYGAWTFADWMLNHFFHIDRPLGSVELLLSPTAALGAWKPADAVAAILGLAPGDQLPVETASFSNINNAFKRWLGRCRTLPGNAAFFYFAGHGVWKAAPLLLPQDAHLPTTSQGPENLIDIRQTATNMFNTQPAIQCFFLDACQNKDAPLMQNLSAAPGKSLYESTNAGEVNREAWLYFGSYTGRPAYGPEDAAPFFTQELIGCMGRRGAATALDEGLWVVNTASLGQALEAAWHYRGEEENEEIRFSVDAGGSTLGELCHIRGTPEAFVKVFCLPPSVMPQARLYVQAAGTRSDRLKPRPEDWYVPVVRGGGHAGADFNAATSLANTVKAFEALPPVSQARLQVQQK